VHNLLGRKWVKHNTLITLAPNLFHTVKPVNSSPAKWGHPVKQRHLVWFWTAVLSANCTLKWGHLWIRDTFRSSQVVCPYFTGFTVLLKCQYWWFPKGWTDLCVYVHCHNMRCKLIIIIWQKCFCVCVFLIYKMVITHFLPTTLVLRILLYTFVFTIAKSFTDLFWQKISKGGNW
jgi:hypothetical protein